MRPKPDNSTRALLPFDAVRTLSLLPLILGLSLALDLLYARLYYVGFFIDDAIYVLGAQSLLHGRYVYLSNPIQNPITTFPPGLPLLLAPFVAVLAPHWWALKLIPIALTLGSCALAARLFKPWLGAGGLAAFMALYALSAAVTTGAGWLMTEPLFVFLTLGIFLTLRRAAQEDAPWLGWLLGAALGWAMIVRPEGVILFPAVAAGLFYGRKWETAARALGAAAMIWGAVLLRNFGLSHAVSGYWPRLLESMGYLSNIPFLVGNWNRVANLFFVVAPFGIDLPYSAAGFAANALLVGAVLWIAGLGVRAVAKQRRADHPLVLAIVVYAVGYFFVHSLWAAIDIRYALPILPFLFAFLVAGARAPLSTRLAPAAAAVLIAALAAWPHAQRLRRSGRGGAATAGFPARTMEWIRRNTPADAIVLSARAPTTFLYTGRSSVAAPPGPAGDAEEYRYRLMRGGIAYVLEQPVAALYRPRLSAHPVELIRERRDWAAASPAAFRPVFSDSSERTKIYQVVDDRAFLKAYELYLSARLEFDRKRYGAGFRDLDAALALQPRLLKALNAYGAASVLSGQRMGSGESKLELALRIDPRHFWARLNLARLYRRAGRRAQAKEAFALARGALEDAPRLTAMRAVVLREEAAAGP